MRGKQSQKSPPGNNQIPPTGELKLEDQEEESCGLSPAPLELDNYSEQVQMLDSMAENYATILRSRELQYQRGCSNYSFRMMYGQNFETDLYQEFIEIVEDHNEDEGFIREVTLVLNSSSQTYDRSRLEACCLPSVLLLENKLFFFSLESQGSNWFHQLFCFDLETFEYTRQTNFTGILDASRSKKLKFAHQLQTGQVMILSTNKSIDKTLHDSPGRAL